MKLHCRLTPLILLPFVAASCLETPKNETASSSPMSRSLESRILSRDPNRRSSFEKSMPSSLQPQSDTSGVFGKKLFGTGRSVETKAVAGVREFQVPKNNFASKSNWFGKQQAREGKQTAFGTSETFSTPANRMATESSRMSSDSFYAGGDEFSTFSNFAGAKALKKNTKPNIVQKADGGLEAAYTEEQVRSLMNRN